MIVEVNKSFFLYSKRLYHDASDVARHEDDSADPGRRRRLASPPPSPSSPDHDVSSRHRRRRSSNVVREDNDVTGAAAATAAVATADVASPPTPEAAAAPTTTSHDESMSVSLRRTLSDIRRHLELLLEHKKAELAYERLNNSNSYVLQNSAICMEMQLVCNVQRAQNSLKFRKIAGDSTLYNQLCSEFISYMQTCQ